MSTSKRDIAHDLLVAYSLGLLDEASEARFEAHLSECADCRRSLAALTRPTKDSQDDFVHLPTAMVANWEDSVARLRGPERDMVRAHLIECAECRNVLEVLGLESSLPVIPELEAANPDWLGSPGVRAMPSSDPPVPARPARGLKVVRSPHSIGSWIFGASGWAAAAAAIAIVVYRPAALVSNRGESTPGTQPGAVEQAPPAPSPLPSPVTRPTQGVSQPALVAMLSSPAELIPVRRGIDSSSELMDAGAAHVGPHTGWITVSFPEGLWDEPRDRVVDVAIRSPKRRTEYSATLRLSDIDARQELHWPISPDSVVTGTYRLVCRVRPVPGVAGEHVYQGEFRVLVRNH